MSIMPRDLRRRNVIGLLVVLAVLAAYYLTITAPDLEHYRRERRDVDFDEASVMDMGSGPITLLARKQEERLLLEGLRTIPLAMQTVLELYYFEDLTAGELGEILGMPENTVRTRIFRARAALVAVLERIAQTPELLESTTSDLERWATGLRTEVKIP